MTSPELRQITEAAALRALAHPLRQALYEQLVLFGPLTATALADRLDESPSNCSWHLRKLAEHDFVQRAEGGSGRERLWQAGSIGMSWAELEDDEGSRAGDAMTRMMVDRERARLDRSLERLRSDDPRWRAAATVSQSMLWLTDEELAEVSATLERLATAGLERHRDPSLRPPGSRLCALLAWAVPTYDVAEPTPGAEA